MSGADWEEINGQTLPGRRRFRRRNGKRIVVLTQEAKGWSVALMKPGPSVVPLNEDGKPVESLTIMEITSARTLIDAQKLGDQLLKENT